MNIDQDHFFEHGYVICRNVFSKQEVDSIREGVQRIIDRARSGAGADITWINKDKGIPERLGHLLSPDYLQQEVANVYENSPIIEIIEHLLDAPIRFSGGGGGGMLASGDGKGYSLAWHRDKAPSDGDNQMMELLRDSLQLCQFNAPLYDDRYLKIVPGSHIRTTTLDERKVLKNNPNGIMPGEIIVEMGPGDIVFYNPNLLHTGHNPEGHFRWTLHCAFWTMDSPLWSFEERQGTKDLVWLNRPGSLDSYGPKVQKLFNRYIEAAKKQGII